MDFSLFKIDPVHEGWNLQLRFDAAVNPLDLFKPRIAADMRRIQL